MKKIVVFIVYLLISSNAFGNEQQIKQKLNYAINLCQQDMQQWTASGLTLPKYLKFCECYMTELVNAVDEKEVKYQKKYKKPSGKFIKLSKKFKTNCENKVK